ncbi:MAG: high-potential iron-sulfur protein [Burkholderiaceae bacterium]
MSISRRTFLFQSAAVGSSVALLSLSNAQAAAPMVSESDPQAKAVNYVADAKKSTKAQPGQVCSTCALYQGGSAKAGGCAIFPGKQVAGSGWCSAWAKKPA